MIYACCAIPLEIGSWSQEAVCDCESARLVTLWLCYSVVRSWPASFWWPVIDYSCILFMTDATGKTHLAVTGLCGSAHSTLKNRRFFSMSDLDTIILPSNLNQWYQPSDQHDPSLGMAYGLTHQSWLLSWLVKTSQWLVTWESLTSQWPAQHCTRLRVVNWATRKPQNT